jgi:tRNA 5-methylaminomethyl-2-thiouridine biosynthesis bifunctional protein
VVVIGAGVAGAALTRALAALGARPLVLEAERPGAGASGNPAALVTPGLDAAGGARAALYAQALARAADLYGALGPRAVIGQGVLQLEWAQRDARRFDAVAAGSLFDPARLRRLDPKAAADRAGQPLAAGALWFEDGLVVRPGAAIDAWLASGELHQGRAARLERRDGAWRVLGEGGDVLAEADAVCIACGSQAKVLWPGLPLSPVRGQASWAPGGPSLLCALAWGGYAAPFEGGLLFGATHNRGRDDRDLSPADQARNLASLAEALPDVAARITLGTLEGRVGVRAATPDRLPLAGALEKAGVYVLGGLGSRGFTTAPLLAEHVAAQVCAAPSPLPAALQRTIDPGRFASAGSP